MTASAPQPIFNIEKIYVRDMSLEVPNAPHVYLDQAVPEVEVQLHTKGSAVGENVYEVALKVTVNAKAGEKSVFLVEVEQAGLFRVENVPQTDLEAVLGITCPNILFPYARELISSSVNRAGFPPVILAPVNFEALYLQQHQQSEGAAASPVQ